MPFSAEIIKRNDKVIDNPEILQNDPIDQGWLLIIKPLEDLSLGDLMSSDEYRTKVAPN